MGAVNYPGVSYARAQTSTIPIRLVSSDTPATLDEAVTALTTDFTLPEFSDSSSPLVRTGSDKDPQSVNGASVIVSTASILISVGNGIPTFVDLIDTTLTTTAAVDLGSVTSDVTNITANHVKLNVAATTAIQVGVKVVIAGTVNYNGTFFIESIGTTFISIKSAFTAETVNVADTVKSPNVGITVAAGEIYQLNSTEDARNFSFVSAATGVPGTLDIDLKFGG